jgi:hypothetical protein
MPVDPNVLNWIARIESGGNPNARTGSYKGLYQLSDQEFNDNGGGNIYDPADNRRAAENKFSRESESFRQQYGRDPSGFELYMVHQQGPGGFAAHTSNPDAPAWQNMLSTAEGRQKGAGWAKQAIWGNVPDDVKRQFPGGVDSLTSRQFMDLWKNKTSRFSGEDDPEVDPMSAYVAQRAGLTPPPDLGAFGPARGDGQQGLEHGLNGLAASLMSIYNPKGAAILLANAEGGKDHWGITTLPDGRVVQQNARDGSIRLLGNAPKQFKPPDLQSTTINGQPAVFNKTEGKYYDAQGNPITDFPSAGEKKQDEAFAKDNELWTSGGATDAAKAVTQLKDVAAKLRAAGGKKIFATGSNPNGAANLGEALGPTGPIAGMLPDVVNSFINPEALDLRGRVGEVIQRGARGVLGAQYTQKEGEQFFQNTYNPRLSPEKNADRIEALANQMEAAAQAKQAKAAHFGQTGTLKGYKGPEPDFANFGVIKDEETKAKKPIDAFFK